VSSESQLGLDLVKIRQQRGRVEVATVVRTGAYPRSLKSASEPSGLAWVEQAKSP
jgi:hypothetical protein